VHSIEISAYEVAASIIIKLRMEMEFIRKIAPSHQAARGGMGMK